MKLIERIYSHGHTLEPDKPLQTQLNKAARNVSLAPPQTTVYEQQTSQNTTVIPCPIDTTLSPFYAYTLYLDSPTSGRLVVIPRSPHDSNRYHSVVTQDGAIITVRGRAEYSLGTSKRRGEHEQLGMAVSSPRRGRKKSQSFELVATFSYSLFAPTQRLERSMRRDTPSMGSLVAFLEEAQRASPR